MKVEQVLHMVGGAGGTSYASNSKLQEKFLLMAKPILRDAIEGVYGSLLLPDRMVVADLGCSSGPNTLLMVSEVLDIVCDRWGRLGRRREPPLEIQFFLNDLPGNDFNQVFGSLEEYRMRKVEEKGDLLVPYYVAGLPGSFYGRLFPCRTVQLFHSAASLHWLSQVPQGLVESGQGASLNKGNIYIAETSPPEVVKAYQEQYRRDFSTFLKCRHAELRHGGRMVLSFLGRKKRDPPHGGMGYFLGVLAEALNALVSEGIIQQEKLVTFNLPLYSPSMEEIEAVIHSEGLFDLEQAQILETNWDPFDDSDDDFEFDSLVSGKNVAKYIRAALQPLIAHQFGDDILDELFSRYAANVSRHLLKEKTKHTMFAICLNKKVESHIAAA